MKNKGLIILGKIFLSFLCILFAVIIQEKCRANGIVLGAIPTIIIYLPVMCALPLIWQKKLELPKSDIPEEDNLDASENSEVQERSKAVERKSPLVPIVIIGGLLLIAVFTIVKPFSIPVQPTEESDLSASISAPESTVADNYRAGFSDGYSEGYEAGRIEGEKTANDAVNIARSNERYAQTARNSAQSATRRILDYIAKAKKKELNDIADAWTRMQILNSLQGLYPDMSPDDADSFLQALCE